MSKTVDQRVVEMRFDNNQFEKGISESIKSLDKLKASLNFDNAIPKSTIDSISNNLNGLTSSVDSIADKFSVMGIAATTAIAKISSSVMDLAQNAIQTLIHNAEAGYNRYNEMMGSIQTIMYATRNEWADTGAQMDYVTGQIDKLNWYTDETSYNLSDMTNSIGKFVSAGISLDDATTAMEGIASWAAISGQNAEKASYAMYNLSQAMSMGKVTTVDWKSIENANMATREFKWVAKETAIELGKLWTEYDEELDDWYTVGLDQYGHEMRVTLDNFRTTLAGGWFDRDVLTATLKKYGDFADKLYDAVETTGTTTTEFLGYLEDYEEAAEKGTDLSKWVQNLARKENITNVTALGEALELLSGDYYELGRSAFKAAQESKTFKDSMDYTADAITTTWMNIFQDIFGNYLESKELWTDVSELMYEQMVRPLEEIEEVFASWNATGGADYLKEAFWNFYSTFVDVKNAMIDGWNEVFRTITGVDLTVLSIKLRNFSEQIQLKNRVVFSDYNNIRDAVASLGRVFLDFKISFGIVYKAIKDAWARIFPSKETISVVETFGYKIKKFGEWLEELSSKFRLTGEDGEKLERTFAGLFAVLDIGRLLLIAILEPFTNFNTEVGEVSHGIFDVTASIGDWLVALRDFIKENEIFRKAMAWLTFILQKLPVYADNLSKKLFGMGISELLTEIVNTAAGLFVLLAGMFIDFEKTMDEADKYMAKSKFANVWPMIKNFIIGVKNAISDLKIFFKGSEDESKTGVLGFFSNIWSAIKGFFANVKEKAVNIWGYVSGFATGAWGKLTGFFAKVKEDVVDIFSVFSDDSLTFGEKIKTFFSSIGDKITELWENNSDDAKDAWSSVVTFFEKIGKKISNKWSGSKLGQWFIDLGEKIKDLWSSLSDNAGLAWSKIKDFFGLAGTKAGEIWDAIPGWIETAWTNIKSFFDSVKAKFLEIWDIIQPYVAKFVDAMKSFAKTIGDHWDEIWAAIVGFFAWIGDHGAKAIDWIISIDWAGWWANIKKWCEDTWYAIRKFFEELPGKAKQSFEDLTGIGWEEFLDNISTAWENLKDKVQETWDKISDFVADVPNKLEKLATNFGFNSWAEMWDSISKSIGEAWQNFKYFFELEKPEWMDENGNPLMKFDETNMPEGWTAKKISNFKTISDFIPTLSDVFDSLDKISDTDFAKHIKTILGIAAALAALWLLKKTFDSFSNLINEVETFRPFKTSTAEFAENLGETVASFKKVNAAAAVSLYADTFVKIAASLIAVAAIKPERLVPAVISLGILFALLMSSMTYMEKEIKNGDTIEPGQLIKIATAVDMLAGVIITIAGALWIVGQLDIGTMAAATGSLTFLFAALVSVFIYFDQMGVPNTTTMAEFAKAIGMLSGTLVVIAVALKILDHMRIDRMIASALSIGLLFSALIGSLIIVDKMTSGAIQANNYVVFAEAIGMLSGSLVIIATALKILDGMGWESMIAGTASMAILFGGLIAALIILDKFNVSTSKVGYFAGAMVGLSAALVVIASAMRILNGMELDAMIISAGALIILIGIMTGLFLVIDKFVSDEAKMLAFAGSMTILGVAMIALAGALYIMKDIDPKNMWNAVGALAALFALCAVGGAVGSYIGPGMLMFAGAIAIIGLGAMAAGEGMLKIAIGLEKMAAVGEAGFVGITNGLLFLSAAGPEIVSNFLDALMALATGIGPVIIAFITSLANAISENRDSITNGIVDFWMILIDAFNRVVPNLIDSIAAAVNQIVNKIRDLLVKVARIINANRDLFTQGLTNFFMIFVDTFRNVSPEFVSAFGVFLHAVLEMLQGLWPEIESFLLMAGETALLLLGQLVTGLIQILIDNGPLLLELLRFLFEGTLGIIEEYTPIITSLAFELLMDTLNQILDNIDDVVSVTTQIAIATINGFIAGITEQIPNIIDTGVEFVLALINGVAKGLDDHAADIKDAMDNLARSMLRAFLIFMGMDPDEAGSVATRWVNIGKDLMESLIKGINDFASNVAEAVVNVAKNMTDAWTGQVKEGSPSKEFEQHGMYIDLGLVNGINKGSHLVSDATSNLGKDAIDSLGTTFENLKNKIFGDFEFDPTITPVLDLSNVTEGANYINDLFSADRALALAGLDSDGINSMVTNQDALNSLLNKLNMPTGNSDQNQNGIVNNNTFNITGDDPQAIANEISNILQSQVERRDSVWA